MTLSLMQRDDFVSILCIINEMLYISVVFVYTDTHMFCVLVDALLCN